MTITDYAGAGGPVAIPSTIENLPVTLLGALCFEGCSNVTSVTVPETVTGIEYWAFRFCTGLISINIPNGVTRIENDAFAYCTSLHSISLPDSLVRLDFGAFERSGLTNVTLPRGLETLSPWTFYACKNLAQVIVPETLSFIGEEAFGYCESLAGVYFCGNAPDLDLSGSAFLGAARSTIYYLPWRTGWGATFAGRPTAPWVCRGQVTSIADSGAGSLREALTQANAAGGGYIDLSGLRGTIFLGSELPTIEGQTVVAGPGSTQLAISGLGTWPIFRVAAGATFTVSGLTLRDGLADRGGGICTTGTTTVLNCCLSNNTARVEGGGIASYSSLVVSNSGIFNNNAFLLYTTGQKGGGIYSLGHLSVISCTIASNRTDTAGGGICSSGDLVVQDSVVSGNRWYDEQQPQFKGGGIWTTGASSIVNCSISANGAWNAGGIYCAGNTALSDTAVLSNTTGGSPSSRSGGISASGELTISDCKISNNSSADGAAGLGFSGSRLAIRNSTLLSNCCYWGAGGIWASAQVASIENCLILGNSTPLVATPGAIVNFGALGITNCTFTTNRESAINNSGTLFLNGCTFVHNQGHSPAVLPSVLGTSGTSRILGSIIASNTEPIGILNSAGWNLVDKPGTNVIGEVTGNIYAFDPRLGPLQDNGGPTLTYALLADSPAIDAGPTNGAPATDQRGLPRPRGLRADIGAYEYQFPPGRLGPPVKNGSKIAFDLLGPSGATYILQASSDLVQWTPFWTNAVPAAGALSFLCGGILHRPNEFYRAVPWPVAKVTQLPLSSATITGPFLFVDNYIYQFGETNLAQSGRAEFLFTLDKTGDYVVMAMVDAPNEGANSLYLNMNAEPRDPEMISDIPVTTGFQGRLLSWRGTGTFDHNEFRPRLFHLAAGQHRLIIRAREGGTMLQRIAIWGEPGPPP